MEGEASLHLLPPNSTTWVKSPTVGLCLSQACGTSDFLTSRTELVTNPFQVPVRTLGCKFNGLFLLQCFILKSSSAV